MIEIFKSKDSDFAEKLKLNPITGCIEWTGNIGSTGYGRVGRYGYRYKAHRWAWILIHGNLDEDKLVCHKCDNPLCVNVDHLFLGNHRDNALDMFAKGRNRNISVGVGTGQDHPNTCLKDDDIKKIKALYPAINGVNLAKLFNLSRAQISRIISGKRWGHIKPSPEEVQIVKEQWASQYT